MVWIKELQITACSMLKCPVNLKFNQGTNYILGVNGSGKTTLMQVIKGIYQLNFKEILIPSEQLEISVKLVCDEYLYDIQYSRDKVKPVDYNDSKLSFRNHHMPIDSSSENYCINIRDNHDHAICFQITNQDITITINSNPKIFNSTVKFTGSRHCLSEALFTIFLELNDSTFALEIKPYVKMIEESIWEGMTFLFTEGLEENEKILDIGSMIFQDKKHNIKQVDFTHLNLNKLREIMEKALAPQYDNEQFSFSTKDVDGLQHIAEMVCVDRMTLNYFIESVKNNGVGTVVVFKLSHIGVVLKNGDKINYHELSYGQKRYIMIMLYLASSQTCRLLDEPVNGLHHSLIDDVMNRVSNAGIQTFITNQNPALFDCIEFSSRDDFQSRVVLCTLENDKMSWNNPSDDFSDKFYEDYANNFLNVSSILKFNQIW